MAAKNNARPAKKKSGARGKTSRTRASGSGSLRARAVKSRNATYVLVIMLLLTALVLLVNKYYDTIEPGQKKPSQKQMAAEERGKTAEPKKDPGEKREKSDKQIKKEPAGTAQRETQETKPEEEEVRLYFIQFNEKSEKMYLSPVVRKVEKKPLLENTLKELIKGPTPQEKKKGLLSAVPSELRLNGVRIKNNTAELDFNSAIERGAGGSVLLSRIDQIVYTATQFPSVKSVTIKINGRKQQSLGSDGLSIEGPLHRRR